MLQAVAEYGFMQNAVLASIFAAVICGIIGVIATQKKLLIMSGGIAHTAYGGVGLGYLLGFEPIIGACAFAVGSAFIIATVRKKTNVNTDTVVSLLWSLGMALGVAFMGLMPGYFPDINSYLFGNILSVTRQDVKLMLCFTTVIVTAIVVFYNDWLSFLFDENFSKINGLNTFLLEYFLFLLIALGIVVLIRVVGIILVIALISSPAACAALFAKSFKIQILLASLFCLGFCLVGLALSYHFGIASGATIVIVSVAVYFMLFLAKGLKQ